MNYYKARMYSPTLGRFMQIDPIGYGDGMNIYAYVGGDPVNFVDPSGLRVRWVCVNDKCGFVDDGSGSTTLHSGDVSPASFSLGNSASADILQSLSNGIQDNAKKAWNYAKNCAFGVSSISTKNVAKSAVKGGAKGASAGAVRLGLLGSDFGPETALAGATSGAIGGAISGSIKGAITSAVGQACVAGNK